VFRPKQLQVRKKRKALCAAQLDKAIGQELLEGRHASTHADIYKTFQLLQYNRALVRAAVAVLYSRFHNESSF
jgi:hypothetical protein